MSEGELLCSFVVFGKCEPQGSATAWVPQDKRGNPIRREDGSIVVNVTSDNKHLKAWRRQIAMAADEEWLGASALDEVSLMVETHFYLKRPESHWGTGRNAHLLKDHAPAAPITIPDVDKLLRGILDGMTGVIYTDDARVTRAIPEKHYAVPAATGPGRMAQVLVYRRPQQFARDLPLEERRRYVGTEMLEPVEDDGSQMVLSVSGGNDVLSPQ